MATLRDAPFVPKQLGWGCCLEGIGFSPARRVRRRPWLFAVVRLRCHAVRHSLLRQVTSLLFNSARSVYQDPEVVRVRTDTKARDIRRRVPRSALTILFFSG